MAPQKSNSKTENESELLAILSDTLIDSVLAQDARINEVTQALQEVHAALYWLLNLHHGVSKGHPLPITDAEWKDAIDSGMIASELALRALGADTPSTPAAATTEQVLAAEAHQD